MTGLDRDSNGPSAVSERKRFAVRRAKSSDVRHIAKLASMADGDTLSFILRGIDPTVPTMRVYRAMLAEPTGNFSVSNCMVAVSHGAIVGMANAFPARLISRDIDGIALTEREELLRPRTELNDPDSYLLNNIGVARSHRRRGVGIALLAAVVDDARQQAFPSVTLHVWADNASAIAFYRAAGFEEARRADVPDHPDLAHTGGSLLMSLPI